VRNEAGYTSMTRHPGTGQTSSDAHQPAMMAPVKERSI
jgi:hypothetical protein